MSRMLTPSDILEQIWVRDVVDLTWETLRLRRLKAQFLTATAHEGLAMVLGPLLGAMFVPNETTSAPSAAPGYVAAVLSGLSFLAALFLLPESLRPGRVAARPSLQGSHRSGTAQAGAGFPRGGATSGTG